MFVLVKDNLNIDYLKFRKVAFIASAVIIAVGVIAFFVRRDQAFGVDFTGGCLHQLEFQNPVDLDKLREGLKSADYGSIPIQQFGDAREVIMKAPLKKDTDPNAIADTIDEAIRKVYPENPFTVMRTEVVGPAVGSELTRKAILAALLSLIAIGVYVSLRFEFNFSVGAIAALFHDGFVALGFCALFGVEISLNVVAAVLTILGFSINDTIVIFDRIREERKLNPKTSMYDIINLSLNLCLSRTIITSLTVMLVALSLFFFGGEVIHDFCFTMIVGLVSGTYSTIYIASGILILLEKKVQKAA